MQHPKLVTLTMPAWKGPGQEGIKYLRQCWARLRKTEVFDKVRGGAYSIEVVCHPDYIHIHMHILLDGPFIPYQHLFSAWKEILAIQCPQVDIRSASSEAARGYICKYAAKSPSFTGDQGMIVKWYEATKGQRLFATFGTWYNATINELEGTEEEPEKKMPCPSCGSIGTTYHARDGPMIYGNYTWNQIASCATDGLPDIRLLSITYAKEIQQ